jgi:ligand-binding SRPBCC domain-containing protein
MHTFHSEQWLPLPAELVFAFFANPANLPRLMPGWQNARIEEANIVSPAPAPAPTPPDPANVFSVLAAGEGSRITLSFRLLPFSPVRLRWIARIDSFLWNQHFSDVQLCGPFAHWHHTHTLTPQSRTGQSGIAVAGTLLQDEVQYQLPFGKVGNLAYPLAVRLIRRIFAYRHRRTHELLIGSDSAIL